MKLSKLTELLNKAYETVGDVETLLCYEEAVMLEGYDPEHTEGISDIRLIDDWPLPGKSLTTNEGKIPQKLIIFYDNHYKLDSSIEK